MIRADEEGRSFADEQDSYPGDKMGETKKQE
jgi:hypothetical protein